MGFDFNHPFIDTSTLPRFEAIDSETFKLYGRQVLAVEMTNSQYDSVSSVWAHPTTCALLPHTTGFFPATSW
jgi:hypothetical protein